MYALVEYKGKQYKAEKGAQLQVDLIDAEKGSKIDIDTVVMISNDGKASVGTPYVKGAKVQVVVGDSIKDDKVIVYKYKRKKDYHRTIGHRQQYTMVTVENIVGA
ncbi:MAG TPA: 50S ribosomal protein L21 [Treponemataceae bacterium]|jgi:large subunit ribosomal protein L21|nr:50S ribosomal protein L21 [Treponemataceae bacterium]HPS42887.1 50S ribosomal protein L21 [Treponemataceae bacterium]